MIELKSKVYSDEEISVMRQKIHEKEGIPLHWIIYNEGTNNHFGTCFPHKYITGKAGFHINLKLFPIDKYFGEKEIKTE